MKWLLLCHCDATGILHRAYVTYFLTDILKHNQRIRNIQTPAKHSLLFAPSVPIIIAPIAVTPDTFSTNQIWVRIKVRFHNKIVLNTWMIAALTMSIDCKFILISFFNLLAALQAANLAVAFAP